MCTHVSRPDLTFFDGLQQEAHRSLAAIRLQAFLRGERARLTVAQWHMHALAIQRTWRNSRSKVKRAMQIHEVIRIQRVVRGFAARVWSNRRRRSVFIIQKWFRRRTSDRRAMEEYFHDRSRRRAVRTITRFFIAKLYYVRVLKLIRGFCRLQVGDAPTPSLSPVKFPPSHLRILSVIACLIGRSCAGRWSWDTHSGSPQQEGCGCPQSNRYC